MKFSNGKIEIELEHENTFNIALRAGFKPMAEEETNEQSEEIIEESKEEPNEEIKEYGCKKCEFKTDNKGLLMAHYREIHPKK